MLEESAILKACLKGDSDAWDQLFDLHYQPAGRFVFQLGPDLTAEDVEEICQETFLTVVRNLRTFKGESRVQTWIFRIAANKVQDFRQRRNAHKRGGGQHLISLEQENETTGQALQLPSSEPNAAERLLSTETQASVREALDAVGEPCREILELRYFGDLSYDEIAQTLDLNPKTVSSRLSKCL